MQDRGLQVHNGSPEEQPGLVSYNLLRHPCARHTNRLLWITVALLFGPNVDRPLRSTACLPQMLPAQGDPAAAAPFMTNTRILCFLHKFPGAGCQLSQRWRFLSNLSPGFSCDFKAFDGSERSLATWIMLHGNTGRAAHGTDRCFRQRDNTQLVNKAAVYILYTPLA